MTDKRYRDEHVHPPTYHEAGKEEIGPNERITIPFDANKMIRVLEEIDSYAVAALLPRNSADVLMLVENIHNICQKALGK